MLLKTDAIRRLGKKSKSKRGATLVELIATVAILAIVASLSFQAIFIASEEYRRVTKLSECQRSISLMQENLNRYAKTAVKVGLISSYDSAANINQAVNDFRSDLIAAGDNFQDAENNSSDTYVDYILCANVPDPVNEPDILEFRFMKYNGSTNVFDTVFSVDNIKEMNFDLKLLGSSAHPADKETILLDYTMTSMTTFEIINRSIESSNQSEYAVISGIVLNNIKGSPASAASLRINKDNKTHFVYIRTTKRNAI